jgi:hypothetical protein
LALSILLTKNVGDIMKKNSYKNKMSDSFYDDTFSYLNLESSDSEALYNEEMEVNNILEDHEIQDLDLSELDEKFLDELLLL